MSSCDNYEEDPNIIMNLSDDDDYAEAKKLCKSIPSMTLDEAKPQLPTAWTHHIGLARKREVPVPPVLFGSSIGEVSL